MQSVSAADEIEKTDRQEKNLGGQNLRCSKQRYEGEWEMHAFKFYASDGTMISKETFISFYSQVYYYLNRDLNFEKKIETILYSETLSDKNIIDVLCWKIGAASKNEDAQTVTNQWGTIEVHELIAKIRGEKQKNCDATEMLKQLIGFKGIGPVYAITLLYFITKGKYPIYDRFAHIALKQIESGASFDNVIQDVSLRHEFHAYSTKAEKIYNDYQKHYIRRLTKIFGEEYQTNCDIDRALWAYGHLFSDIKTNRKRIEK